MSSPDTPEPRPPARRRSRWRTTGKVLVVIVGLLVIARIALPSIVRRYVVAAINQDPVYQGEIGDVRLHLWRGAYSIDDVRIVKTTGAVPVPFFAAKRLDLEIEWPAVAAGEVVGRVMMQEPELNFVDAATEAETQTGAGGPWMKMIRDLFPFRINSAEVHEGGVHFRAFHTDPPVDVYLSRVEGTVEDLTNIHEDVTPMVATVKATALAMDRAKVDLEMKLDPFSYRPSFQLAARMLDLDVTKTNALSLAYGKFDFEKGSLDLVVELNSKEGRVEGYVKPIYRDVQVIDVVKDVRNTGVLGAFWQTLLAGVTELFKNQRRDQVATVIPLQGDLASPDTDVLTIVGNLLRNAFIRAYLPKFQGSAAPSITFGRPEPAGDPETSSLGR
jgi:hypothetical protein